MIIASLCSLQYGVLIALEYYQTFNPFFVEGNLAASNYAWSHVFYNVIITTAACFGVAFLSGFLSEQTRKTKNELLAMEDYVKRVDKMAAVGEMAAGLAHELKNPLASLTGSIQLLREDLHYDPAHDRLIQIFLREANRLSSLVNNFLLFAKMPDGKLEPVELGRDIDETIELFEKDNTWNKKISITKEFPPDIWIEIDPVHLRQILWNLILNAAEAIDGEGRIDIKTYPLKGMHAGVKIADNGCGMANDMIRSIFDPFFTTKPSGTGLGLSIVHSIIESYDSRLDIESEVDKGTTVTLTFRRIDPPTSSG